jgi:hypothetical protein
MQETTSTGGVELPRKELNSQERATTEIKGWVKKIQFQRGRLTREQMHHPPFH